MERDEGGDEGGIAARLKRLGVAGREPVAYRRLHGGMSGSAVYAVRVAGKDAVLKVTLPQAAPVVVARARREAAFYRRLGGRVPLRVPEVLASDTADGGIALLLAAYRLPPEPARWPAADFVRVAGQLGRFHAAFWGKSEELGRWRWLRRPRIVDAARRAERGWDALLRDERTAGVLTPRRQQRIVALARRMADAGAGETLPPTLCHGDCHPGNVLRDGDGKLVWADWQEVGMGPGPDDLSFFWQRAWFAGATVPEAAAMTAYCAGLDGGSGRLADRAAIERALVHAELRSWLLDWPPYLAAAPAERLGRVLDRIADLAGRWGIAAG